MLSGLITISRQIEIGEHSTNLHKQYEFTLELIKTVKEEYHLK